MADFHVPIEFTCVTEWKEGNTLRCDESLAAEEPLEIRIHDRSISVTMRTPGHDEELAAGFLWTEGLIECPDDLRGIQKLNPKDAGSGNVIRLDIDEGALQIAPLQRNFFAGSSCGICGKASIDGIRLRNLRPPNVEFRITPDVLCQLPSRLREEQQVFGKTGGLHAAALFGADGTLLVCREDIGRHNAVDKVIGWALLKGMLPLGSVAMMVSGRGGFEIVQKTIAAGIPLLASISAPSSLAVKLARELGLTLVGFLRERRFLIYARPERCLG